MTMKETMEQELAEAIRTLEKANGALARIFNMEEGESDSISWGELAELTHATQVERFGWCGCEDQGTLVYMDCPIKEGENKMGTCMGCLSDFNEDDLVWQGGLLCADCKEGE